MTAAAPNPNTISRYEAGRDVMAGTLRKVADALHEVGLPELLAILLAAGAAAGIALRDQTAQPEDRGTA